jgi:membrane-bound lytic murein transglycosylase B
MRSFIVFVFSLMMFSSSTFADATLLQRKEVKVFVNKMVKQHHFNRQQLISILREAKFQPQIIEAMERPYEKKPWDVYKDLFLTPERLQAGINFWQANRKALERAEKEYGVPAHIIVAIIGVETLYGKHQGTYRVLDALTTLAFDYPKRSPYFTRELEEYLLLCREQGVPADRYLGSYAGAIGKPQFMPSNYRVYAVDFTGNGKRDLINSDFDAIGSVANYFHHHGWTKNGGVAQPVQIDGSAYKKLAINSKTPNYPLKHILAAGVKPLAPITEEPSKAGLFEFTTQAGQEYWVAYPNFYVITRYNSSPQYALVVYLFSQQLHHQWVSAQVNQAKRYT